MTGSALDLAILRIVVCVVMLLSAEVAAPVPDALGRAAQLAVYAGAALGLLGARLGLAVAAVAGFHVLGLRQQHAPVHTHHLLWFAALLAVSPCADTLSLRHPHARNLQGAGYGVPLRAAAALLAAIYFFPGFWKLVVAGPEWLSGEALRGHLHWKWAQSWDHAPPFRVDRVPGLLSIAGTAVLVFELSAPLLFGVRRLWPAAVGGALAFHASTAVFLDIHFSTLWPCLVAVVPVSAVATRVVPATRAPSAVAALAALVVAVVVASALRAERAWPFACYPTFAEPPPRTMPGLAVGLVKGGVEEDVPMAAWLDPEPAAWAEAWRLALRPASDEAWAAWWARTAARPAMADRVPWEEVRIYRVELDVDPDDPAPPRRVRLLATW